MMHKLTRFTLSLLALVVMAGAALAADPGAAFPANAEAGDQKVGSLLYYNIYTSSATAPSGQNTKMNITNTSANFAVPVHLFFVDGSTCSVADSFICLTPNQTATIVASDVDPGITGYLVAVAVDFQNGLPAQFNYLIGDEYVKFSTGHAANLGAVAFSKTTPEVLTTTDGTVAAIFFDGLTGGEGGSSYSRAARVLAVDSIPSRADGNDTMLIVNRVGGNLATGAATLSTLFGLLYDDAESVFSFSVSGGCQLRGSLSNTFPRTTPRLETVIPAGRTGWMKLWSQSDIGITGAVINANPNAGTNASAFAGGHNLHTLTLSGAAVLNIPVFPPSC